MNQAIKSAHDGGDIRTEKRNSCVAPRPSNPSRSSRRENLDDSLKQTLSVPHPAELYRPIILDSRKASYINRLPPEIFSIIFTSCLPESIDQELERYHNKPMNRRNKTLYPPMTPLVLSHVCRNWRSVALSTPALWATIILESGDGVPAAMDSTTVSRWLLLAKNSPLSLRCDYLHEWIVGTIVDNISRWRHLRITADHTFSLNLLFERIRSQESQLTFESLRSLELDTVEDGLTRLRSVFLERSPYLREFFFSFRGEAHPPAVDLAGFQHMQLTRLYIQDAAAISSQRAIQLLKDFPTLTSFSITLDEQDDHEQDRDAAMDSRKSSYAIQHEFLAELELDILCAESELDYFFSRLCAPGLTHLDLTYDTASYTDLESFRDFLNRSSCRIRSLVLTPADSDDLSPALARLLLHSSVQHSLEKLTFWAFDVCEDFESFPVIENDLLDLLTITPSNILMPRLHELNIFGQLGTENGASKVRRMLESRFRAPFVTGTHRQRHSIIRPLNRARLHLRIPRPYINDDDEALMNLVHHTIWDLDLDLRWAEPGSGEVTECGRAGY